MLFRTFSPWLEDIDTFQCSFHSFPHWPLQNCQNYISMYHCPPPPQWSSKWTSLNFFKEKIKMCGKWPKRPPFLRLRELKCIQIDWKPNSTPFWPFKVLGSSTRSWDNIVLRGATLKTENVKFIFETVLKWTCYLWKIYLFDNWVQPCPFKVTYKNFKSLKLYPGMPNVYIG